MQHVRILRRQVVSTVAAAILMGAGWAGVAFGFEESPELKALVDAGKLPPVEKRLPKEPLVLTPLESVGTYGGTWRTATFGGGDSEIERSIGYTRLVRWNPEWTEVIPDIAKSVEVNADATEYTFTLREGTRWSDGEPFTADDLVWWNENVLRNTKITPAAPDWLTAGGETVKVEKHADDKVVFKFAAPNGLFLMNMATVRGSDILAAAPAHYLKQFHKDFNPDGVDALVKAAGATDWVQLFNNKIGFPGRWRDLGRPTLDAWMLTAPYNGTTQVVGERNPYYAKVDTAGNQLPYFDRITIDVMQDTQAIILKAISGEIDMQNRFIETTDARTVIVQNQEKGGYGLFIARPAWSNALLITLNQTHRIRPCAPSFPTRISASASATPSTAKSSTSLSMPDRPSLIRQRRVKALRSTTRRWRPSIWNIMSILPISISIRPALPNMTPKAIASVRTASGSLSRSTP